MATYRLVKAAQPLIETASFDTYNEAVAYMKKTPGASKPFRMNPTDRSSKWSVSKINTKAGAAVYKKVDTFVKPVMYDFIQNVTMFLPMPERIPNPSPSFRSDEQLEQQEPAANFQRRSWEQQPIPGEAQPWRALLTERPGMLSFHNEPLMAA